jgi:hypothetical protein
MRTTKLLLARGNVLSSMFGLDLICCYSSSRMHIVYCSADGCASSQFQIYVVPTCSNFRKREDMVNSLREFTPTRNI